MLLNSGGILIVLHLTPAPHSKYRSVESNQQDTMSMIPMDPDGDLTLEVGADIKGQQGTRFLVCSSTLRRSSPVFKKMLFGPWVDSKPEAGEWVVALPEDMPCATKTVLAIIHGRFELVPQSWGLLSLEKVITFVDKYDMTKILRPWSKKFKDYVSRSVSDPKLRAASIHVAWGLGAQEAFVSTVRDVIFAASMNKDGQLELVGETERLNLSIHEHFGPLNMAGEVIRRVLQSFILTQSKTRLRTRAPPSFRLSWTTFMGS